MQLELYPLLESRVLKVECTDLLEFGNRTDVFFVGESAERVTAVSFLEPSEGVVLVSGSGHITKF